LLGAISGIAVGVLATWTLVKYPLQEGLQLSSGEKILVEADKTLNNTDGVKAFASGNFQDAITKFQSSLQVSRNDPETLIYLNNAKAKAEAKAGNKPTLKIAVSIPMSAKDSSNKDKDSNNNLNIAKEILRGVAQAQYEVNNNPGVLRGSYYR
jgi:branched-chain amino acid transport system substrate-binding protein